MFLNTNQKGKDEKSMKQNILSDKPSTKKLDGKNIFTRNHTYKFMLDENLDQMNKMVEIMMKVLYEKSEREMYHSTRVGKLCKAIAIALDFSKEKVNKMKMTGLIHDIGKIGISKNILNMKQKVKSNEWKEILKHPEIGYRMLKSIEGYSELSQVILEHHERWDGAGYPKGIKGEDILREARIIAIADAYDTMTSTKSYRKKMSKIEAINEIKKCSGTQFDPDIVKIFIDKVLIKNYEI